MSEHDQAIRIGAMLDGIWVSRGGTGSHPPLHVSPAEFAGLVAQGCPPERLRVVEPMPVGGQAFRDCSRRLSDLGQPYPRTCTTCGLGPCRDAKLPAPQLVSAVFLAGKNEMAFAKSIQAALQRAGEAARASLAVSNCIDAGVCRSSPCQCANEASEAAIVRFLADVDSSASLAEAAAQCANAIRKSAGTGEAHDD